MRRVLILANSSEGLYNFRIELIKELISQNYDTYFVVPQSKEDDKVKLITSYGAKYIQTNINRRGINPLQDLKLICAYKKIIKKINPDVILTYTIKPNIYGTYAASKYNIPVIMNITGLGSAFANQRLRPIVMLLYKYACKKANMVFFQNKSNHSLFISNKLVELDKTKIIPGSGVNIDKFKPLNKQKEDGITRFIFIGRIMKEKGIEEYLQAAENITKKYDNIEFQILGIFEEERYKDVILNTKNPRIKYLGVSNDVRNEIRDVDCIVNPSYHEGMSNVLLEGAAMGKPLIASNIPGCKEIIDEDKNGYLFDVKSVKSMEEKIIKFIELDAESKKKMGENSRKKVEKEFDRTIVIREYLDGINKIIKERW